MEKTYRLLKDISTPDGFFEKGTEKKESAWLVWKGIDKEWFTEKDWFEEVKPTRIYMAVYAADFKGRHYRFFYKATNYPAEISQDQHSAVEAAVNGELFTKEDMIEFGNYAVDNWAQRNHTVTEMYYEWLKTRTHAR